MTDLRQWHLFDGPQSSGLTCAFGVAWPGPHLEPPIGTGGGCPRCAAESARLGAAFAAAVAQGRYDADGYTPAERRLKGIR